MLKRISKIVVSDQDNRCATICARGRVLEMWESMKTFESRTAEAASAGNNGLLWRPQPKAPPFGRGLVYFSWFPS
jgi:hypothetical protein